MATTISVHPFSPIELILFPLTFLTPCGRIQASPSFRADSRMRMMNSGGGVLSFSSHCAGMPGKDGEFALPCYVSTFDFFSPLCSANTYIRRMEEKVKHDFTSHAGVVSRRQAKERAKKGTIFQKDFDRCFPHVTDTHFEAAACERERSQREGASVISGWASAGER